MEIRQSVVIVVWNEDKTKLLTVTNRKYGGFTMPSGKPENDEDLEVAAFRELLEETGIKALSLQKLVTIYGTFNKTIWLNTIFLAEVGEQEPKQVEEGTVPSWHTPQELVELGLHMNWYEKFFEMDLI